MRDKPVYLTPEGRAKLQAELKQLREVRRPQVADVIRLSKEYNESDDNPELEEAKNEQAFVEGRILTIEKMLANAVTIDVDHRQHDIVRIGSDVTVKTDDGEVERYTIVGSAEVDPVHGRISNESPVGGALLGKKVGDAVEVKIPSGVLKIEIKAID